LFRVSDIKRRLIDLSSGGLKQAGPSRYSETDELSDLA
jgi:hypothetical protein